MATELPVRVVLAVGETKQLEASPLDIDKTAVPDVTPTWVSGTPLVASVSPGSGLITTLTAEAEGTATVTVTAGGIEREIAVVVRPAVVDIEITVR